MFYNIVLCLSSYCLGEDNITHHYLGSCDCDHSEVYCGSCVAGKVEGIQNTSTSGTSTSSKEKSSISKYKRFEMNWTVDLDPGWLPDNKKTLQLCRESFSFLYGFSPNLMKKTSKK